MVPCLESAVPKRFREWFEDLYEFRDSKSSLGLTSSMGKAKMFDFGKQNFLRMFFSGFGFSAYLY